MAAGAISLGAMSVLPAAAAPTAAFAEEAAPAAAPQKESFVSDGSPEELRQQLEDADFRVQKIPEPLHIVPFGRMYE